MRENWISEMSSMLAMWRRLSSEMCFSCSKDSKCSKKRRSLMYALKLSQRAIGLKKWRIPCFAQNFNKKKVVSNPSYR